MVTRYSSAVVVTLCLAAAAGCGRAKAGEHVKRGNLYFDEKKYAEAIIEFRGALQADAKLGDVRLKLGDAYLATNDPGNALREYVRASDLLPKSVEAHVKAGKFLLFARQFEDAKSRAERALELDPKNVEAQILKGNALAGLKDFDAAMSEYQDAIAIDPTLNVAYSNLGVIQLAQGKRDEAEATFKRAVEAAPRQVGPHLALANFYWGTGRQNDAETELKSALALDDKEATANRALGLFYMATNRVKEAEPYFVALARVANTDDTVLALADYYTVAKRFEDARRILQERASRDSAYAAATVRLAALEATEGHRSQAQDRLHELLEKRPKDAPALLLSARLHMMDGKRDEAKKDAERVIANEQYSAAAVQAYLIVGQLAAASDRREDAIKAYEQVLKMDPKPLAANVALSSLYLSAGDKSRALTHAQQALAIAPESPEAQNCLIRSELMGGDFATANRDLAALEKRFPGAIGVTKLKALVQLAENKKDAARASYDQVLRSSPRDFEALTAVSTIDLGAGRAKEAAARLENHLKTFEPSVDVLVLTARVHLAAGDADRAEALLKQAIEKDPERLQAYGLLGRYYAVHRRLEEAKEQYRVLLTRNPKSIAAGTMLGMLLEQQGRASEAEKEYERVLSVDSHAAVAANNLAWIYVASNRKLDEALQLAQTAQQQLPDEPHVNDTLGWIYFRKNMASQALPFLESCAQKAPDEATHHFHLGMAYAQVGDWEKAKRSLKQAFSLQADFDGAAEARKALAMIGA